MWIRSLVVSGFLFERENLVNWQANLVILKANLVKMIINLVIFEANLVISLIKWLWRMKQQK